MANSNVIDYQFLTCNKIHSTLFPFEKVEQRAKGLFKMQIKTAKQ